MFIVNASQLSNVVTVSERLGKYISRHYGVPVLGMDNEGYVFSDTERFREALKLIPWYVKLFL